MVSGNYKTTELGLIPSDWEALSLSENFDFFQNNTYSRDCLNLSKGDVQNIHYGDVLIKYDSLLDCEVENIPFINPGIQVNLVKRLVQSGDIIIADTAEDNTVGKATEVINVGKRNIVSGLHTVFIRPHSGLFVERFLGYFINSSTYHDQLLPYIVGTKVSSVSKGSLQETYVLRPPLPEQHCIAVALSDTDALIAALEKLIAKKRAVKQGAMQELLTGKRRLDGFSVDWVEKKLGDTYKNITTGKLDANAMYALGKYRFYTCAKEYFYIDTYAFDDEALLISGNGANVGYIHYYKGKFNAYQRTYVLTGFVDDIFFVKHYLSKYLSDRIEKEVNAGGTPFIKKDTIDDMMICIPSTLEEQTAIASILSDMDAEIDALTTKLDKLRNTKQGMMSELLTGRIRLLEEA